MIGIIEATIERVRGASSGGRRGTHGRRIVAVALLLVLVGLSGYLAAASGVTVDFSVGVDGDRSVDGAITEGAADGSPETDAASEAALPEGDRPEGFVGDGVADRPDTDGDGIADRAERELYGTDPNVSDTDGDGIPDGMELACSEAYPDADPLRQDVYVELDSVAGVELSDQSKERLRAAFADGPVENPGGESGIALHLVESNETLPEADSVNDDRREGEYNDVEDYRDDHFEYEQAGYHYLLISTNVAYNGDDHYAGAGRPGMALVEHYDRDGVMTSLTMHELGHAFGLGRSMEGVDTRKYDRDGYHSVMNYNILYETTTFSDGEDDVGRDEWSFIAEDRHTPSIDRDDGFCPDLG